MTLLSQESANAEKNQQLPFFYMGMSLFFMLLVFIGFGPTYFMPLLSGQEASSVTIEMGWIVHLHAIIFVGWMILIIIQTILITVDKTEVHMKMGFGGLGLGVLVILMGALMSYLSFQGFMTKFDMDMISAAAGTGPS